jgi:UDP-N-acetylmuramoyl-L-alanyl-D-glutamate--2,6-diaminopimelate ligase
MSYGRCLPAPNARKPLAFFCICNTNGAQKKVSAEVLVRPPFGAPGTKSLRLSRIQSMRIADALADVETLGQTAAEAEVTGVQYDSRRVRPGDVFVAMRGGATDGNRFVAGAIERGARVVVTDSPEVFAAGLTVPAYLVANGRRALAGIAANLLGHPERSLKVSAVTGTNGKTTTAWLLEQMLRSVGRQCVLIGTIETHVGDEVRASEHTTPEASDLLQTFADGVAAGATEVVMEMSSHALDQERVWGVQVDVAIFTNLTQDHLDYHGTMEAYAAAKAKLFEGVGAEPPRVSVMNVDDFFGVIVAREMKHRELLAYGTEWAGTHRATNVKLKAGSTSFDLVTPNGTIGVESPLTGRVNVYNLLAASCAALARGLSLEQIAAAARSLRQVPGRFQTVPNERGITVVVDYAHTEDALSNLIALARELAREHRVITLFGCGGDRDKTKRPKMGRAAGEGSDLVVLTSDNPRSEDPAVIIDEALAGVRQTDAECIVEIDRATAIEIAIRAALRGDIVLIAGKGHEKVQILRDETVPFDDVEVAAGVLRRIAKD